MPDRSSLVSALLLSASLALLASVLVAPIRSCGFATVPARPDFHRRNFALPPNQSASRLAASMATDAALRVNVPPSGDEEQDLAENEEKDQADPLDEARVSLLIPYSFRKIPDRQSIAPPSILSLYPLRC